MCVIEKITGIHITTKDKVDLSVSLVTLADVIWFIGDMYHGAIHPHHYVVLVLLFLGTAFSFKLIYNLCKRHHLIWTEKQSKKASELSDRRPTVKHSEK